MIDSNRDEYPLVFEHRDPLCTFVIHKYSRSSIGTLVPKPYHNELDYPYSTLIHLPKDKSFWDNFKVRPWSYKEFETRWSHPEDSQDLLDLDKEKEDYEL